MGGPVAQQPPNQFSLASPPPKPVFSGHLFPADFPRIPKEEFPEGTPLGRLGGATKTFIFLGFYKVFRLYRFVFSFADKPNAFCILVGNFSANGPQKSS